MGQRCCKECCGGAGGSDDDSSSVGSGYHALNDTPDRHGMPPRTASSAASLHTCHNGMCGSGHGGSTNDCPASARSPTSARMRPSPSGESVGSHGAGAEGDGAKSARGGGKKKRGGFWAALRPGGRRSGDAKERPPPKRASGYDMLDRTQVVCLLGSGAFGSVSLVFHRPTAQQQQQQAAAFPSSPQAGHTAFGTPALNESAHIDPVTPPARTPTSAHGPLSPSGGTVAPDRTPPTVDVTFVGTQTPGLGSPVAGRTPQFGRPAATIAEYAAAPVSLPPRAKMLSTDDVASLASSFAGHGNSFAHGSALNNTSQCFARSGGRRIRFSVLKRISKRLKATIQGASVDIAAERFRSAGLRHPFVMRLLEASQTESDYYNVFPFCLGADVGRMLSRRLSEVVIDAGATCAGDNIAALTRAIRDRALEGTHAPSRCTCRSAPVGHVSPTSPEPPSVPASLHASSLGNAFAHPVDKMCPVFNWAATEGGLPLPTVALMAFEVLSALQFLATHANRITHGDLKPENVFVSDAGHLLLGDFSLMTVGVLEPEPASAGLKKRPSGLNKSFANLFGSSSSHADTSSTTTSHTGPGARGSPSQSPLDKREVERNPRYMPPEVVMGQWSPIPLPKDPGKEPVLDMWSYGVMLLEAATGVHPFFPVGTPVQHVGAMTKLTRGSYEPIPYPAQPTTPQLPPTATLEEKEQARDTAEQAYDGVVEAIDLLNDLIRRCIQVDPGKRITPSEAQLHPFFRHPLVLTHLGVHPTAVAYEAAHQLARIAHFSSYPEAEAAFFVPDTERVNWPAFDKDQALSHAFLSVLWDSVVLHENLQPPVVPREVCANGGLWVPEDVDLTLTGKELFSSFCNTSAVAPSANVSFAQQGFLSGQGSYAGFSMVIASPDARNGRGPSDAPHAAGAGTNSRQDTCRVSFDADDGHPTPPQHNRSRRHSRTLSGAGSDHQGGSRASGGVNAAAASAACSPSDDASPGKSTTQASTSPQSTLQGRPAESFGDPRMPGFCPVDLRFFAQTQAEFDHWDDPKNKKWLARTDADIREEGTAAEQQREAMQNQPQTSGRGRGRGAMNGHGGRGGHSGFSPEFLANYTYRGFDSAIFH